MVNSLDKQGSQTAQRAAARLHEVITARAGIAPKFPRRKWEKAIDSLISRLVGENKEGRVLAAVEWLALPSSKWTVRSADNFADTFDIIEGKMNKSAPAARSDEKLDEKGEEFVKGICRNIRSRSGIDDPALPSVIRASYVNWVAMRAKWRKTPKPANRLRTGTDDHIMHDFAFHAMHDVFLCPDHYLTKWFLDLYSDALRWDRWNGDITKFVFHLDHKDFDIQCCRLDREWSNTTKGWKLLKEYLR